MATELTNQLKNARGKRYWDILKAILYGPTGQCIVNDFNEVSKGKTASFTLADLCRLCIKYDLPFKAVCEWLEEKECLPTGTYWKLQQRGLKVRKVLQQVRELDEKKEGQQ